MHVLDKTLRKKLENTITRAREVAENAARSAIEQLGVEQSTAYEYLTVEQRELRRKLRAHGRQLGDERDQKTQMQEFGRLTEEVAYEHWHRMLFARFLAENKLLMFYDGDDIDNAVAVSLDECEEMATEMKCSNGWELAARLAGKMLPQIFRAESPVFEMQFSPEKLRELEVLLAELVSDVFTSSDSLGWVYQFWQSKKKELINRSEVKIGAKELPAVTQLFTEPYMVSFLLDNSLGAWWSKKRLSEEDFKNAVSEDELRNKASLRGVPLDYLRFIKGENGCWSPVGGAFEGWPDHLSELKALDPCCGSGHFLVSAFLMLVPIRMELEGISAREACDAVLSENIHGLEIDQRCVELAAFALALTAWKYDNAGGFRVLPDLQIAWCGQSVNVKKEEWLALAEGDTDLRVHLEGLYELFQDAPVLGSLLNPRYSFEEGSFFEKDWEMVSKVLHSKLEKKKYGDDGLGVVAQGMEKTFQLLSDKYHWVITNVPYLGMRKQNNRLRCYSEDYHQRAKSDLATVFLDRYLNNSIKNGGVYSVVTPSALLKKDSFKSLRKYLLESYYINSIALLGTRAFGTITGEVVDVILIIISNSSQVGQYFSYVDVSMEKDVESKLNNLVCSEMSLLKQDEQLQNPDYKIQRKNYGKLKLLIDYCECPQGIKTGDDEKWLRLFWEVNPLNETTWDYCQSSSKGEDLFGGLEKIIDWSTNGIGMIRPRLDSPAVGRKSIGLSQTGSKRPAIFMGTRFDSNIAPIISYNDSNNLAVFAYCTSDIFLDSLSENKSGLFTTNTALMQVPFDLEYWENVAQVNYSNGLPKPYSDDPTQWIFHGYPVKSEAPLQVAVARLMGYRWPAEIDKDMELSDEAKDLVTKCEELLSYADEDGIVCIPSVRGEAPASERLLNLLAIAYKGQDINAIVSEFLVSCDHAGKSLESWLREKFFCQHSKLFGQRPFIWHIWDGLSDGFAALVNYHKLDRKNLETLTYTYLGDWINKQKAEITAGADGAEEKLAAAENLKKSLELILEGELPYDIFVRWKPIYLQSIGWEPDINDGVRMNIRPFISVPDVGKSGAGILRDKPNIKWDKDRGKDSAKSHWFNKFNGERVNDWHLPLEDKYNAGKEAIIK